jgi:chromosome segregation and condensation protein ScpB
MTKAPRVYVREKRWLAIIEALLHTNSVEEASKAAKVRAQTIYRLLAKPGFAEYFDRIKHQKYKTVIDRSSVTTGEALAVLRKALESPDERVTAARALLDFGLRAKAADYEERLAALEKTASQPAYTLQPPEDEPAEPEVSSGPELVYAKVQ